MKHLYIFIILLPLLVACTGPNIPEIDSTADLSTCTTAGVAEQSDDADIEALREAMVAFRASLPEDLLIQAQNCLDSERLTRWHNGPVFSALKRHGIFYGDLNDSQLALFQVLLQQFLSSEGYQKVDEITFIADAILNEDDPETFSPDFHSIDMFGDPENRGSWGFQLDGHHIAVNFLVHGDSVSIVPAFLATEPAIGTYDGVDFDIFQAEREAGIAMYAGLSDSELAAATSTQDDAELQAGPPSRNGNPDPYAGDYDYSKFETGLKYSDMSAETQSNLEALMKIFVYNLTTPFADVWWQDIENNMDDTFFVWISEVDEPNDFSFIYFRIYNPHVWIEYNVESSVSSDLDGDHVHTITRIPSTANGGDYGIFANMINGGGPATLLEHYSQTDHHAFELVQLDYSFADSSHSHNH